MIVLLRLIVFCCVHFFAMYGNNISNPIHQEWTWMHSTTFNHRIRAANIHKKELLFKKEDIAPFTQLLVSWNILRPEKGYFVFYAQVRDAKTKEWGGWHEMVHWGCTIQKTYVSKGNGLSSYAHVRLELDATKEADAFCIKIESHEGAHLGLLHALSVSLSHFGLFKSEESAFIKDNLKSVVISGIPVIAQFALDHVDNSRICSPTSCAMVVEYIMGASVNMNDFIAAIFDEGLSVYGSWQCNVAHAFDMCKGKANFFVKRANTFADVHSYLERKLPVIVSVRGELPGALKSFPHGHLMVVVGWDSAEHVVVCHDPAAHSNDTVLKRYPLEPFLRAWERSHRLMYVVNFTK